MNALRLSRLRRGACLAALALTPVAFGLVFAACGGCGGGAATHPDAGGDVPVARPDGGDATASFPDGGDALADAGDAAGVLQTQVINYQYDPANRLKSATIGVNGMAPASSATPHFSYGYDQASNPTTITTNGVTQSPTYASTNEIIGGDYDLNGNPKTLNGAVYTWDAANRLASATVGDVETDFTYDGMSRLVRIVSKKGGSIISDKAYTWSGTTRVAEHDNLQSGSPVSKQYFDQGVIAGGKPYYYASDSLGSVRQLVDASGTIHAQYDYDPYGNQTKLNGDVDSDIGYAGYFNNRTSGLDLAVYRAYSPHQARWVNRDPIGEVGGINLYEYAASNPVGWTDPLGSQIASPVVAGGGAILAGGGTTLGEGTVTAACTTTPAGITVCTGIAIVITVGAMCYAGYRYFADSKPSVDPEKCDKQLEADTETCDALFRKFGPKKYAICMQQAHERYGNCLAGRDQVPPLPSFGN